MVRTCQAKKITACIKQRIGHCRIMLLLHREMQSLISHNRLLFRDGSYTKPLRCQCACGKVLASYLFSMFCRCIFPRLALAAFLAILFRSSLVIVLGDAFRPFYYLFALCSPYTLKLRRGSAKRWIAFGCRILKGGFNLTGGLFRHLTCSLIYVSACFGLPLQLLHAASMAHPRNQSGPKNVKVAQYRPRAFLDLPCACT
jgi:hypothetical protein